MPAWLSAILVNFVLGSVMAKLKATEQAINWPAFQSALDAEIQKIPFGDFVDSELAGVANNCVGALEVLVNGPLQQTLISDLLAGNFTGAIAAVKAAIISVVTPAV
jgi:hypothetical protein